MSKPLVTPTRYVIRAYLADGTKREFVLEEGAEPNYFPSTPFALGALFLDEVVNGFTNRLLIWKAPFPR